MASQEGLCCMELVASQSFVYLFVCLFVCLLVGWLVYVKSHERIADFTVFIHYSVKCNISFFKSFRSRGARVAKSV